jgi:hypothetical protein
MHFRYDGLIHVEEFEGEERKRPIEVTYDIQRFSNTFFQHLHHRGLCSKLNALAIGTYWEARRQLNADEWHVPRHCFIRGYQTDFLNRRTAIAISVSTYTLQQYEPDSSF